MIHPSGYIPLIGALLLLAFSYSWGWRKMRGASISIATYPRLLLFVTGLLFVALAVIWPLPDGSRTLLSYRAMQKILVCMIAPPLLWLACPMHVMASGLPLRLRGMVVRLRRPANDRATGAQRHRWRRLVYFATQPAAAWLLFISGFLLWHDPATAQFTLQNEVAHCVAPIVLLALAMLFWWHIVETSPRIHKHLPAGVLVAYLVGAEISNMAAGVSIAYSSSPLYPHYASVRVALSAAGQDSIAVSVLEDQMIAGALVWVCGSLVYVSTIIAVLRRLFYREGSSVPQPAPNWDAHEKFVAPGLEHRVVENRHLDTEI